MEIVACDSEHMVFAGHAARVYDIPKNKELIVNGKFRYYELSETIYKDNLVICKYLVQVDEV